MTDPSTSHKSGASDHNLQLVLLFDLKRRQEVLLEELKHLRDALSYQSIGQGNTSSTASFASRVKKAATELHQEATADKTERERFEQWYSAREAKSLQELQVLQCFDMAWQSKMRIKASVIAERLGELHDKLEQYSAHTNPDHPNPILRRRAELGQVDKYLAEHVKWVHRDIARFVSHYAHASYPYTEVPATFHAWQYGSSSSQHSFVSFENYKKWKINRHHQKPTLSIDSFVQYMRRLIGGSTQQPRHIDQKKYAEWVGARIPPKSVPDKFATVGLRYWMPERIVSHPIIGHEIAHLVLQDLYGRDKPFEVLDQDTSIMGRTLRQLILTCEKWLSGRSVPNLFSREMAWDFAREIMCDLLAAERYGCAYLFAWVAEVSEMQDLAHCFQDIHGMLRPVDDFESECRPAKIVKEILVPAVVLTNRGPLEIYHRGKVLIAYLSALQRERTDATARELIEQVELWLDNYLLLCTGKLLEQVRNDLPSQCTVDHAYEKAFAADLVTNVVRPSRSGSDHQEVVGSVELCSHPNPRADFVGSTDHHWAKGSSAESKKSFEDLCLHLQKLSEQFKTCYVAFLAQMQVADNPNQPAGQHPVISTLNDAIWRAEWLIQGRRIATSASGQETARSELTLIEKNYIRALNGLLLDDYLHRTGNPHRLLQVLQQSRDSKNTLANPDSSAPVDRSVRLAQALMSLTEKSNQVDDLICSIFRVRHSPVWLSEVKTRQKSFRLVSQQQFSIDRDATGDEAKPLNVTLEGLQEKRPAPIFAFKQEDWTMFGLFEMDWSKDIRLGEPKTLDSISMQIKVLHLVTLQTTLLGQDLVSKHLKNKYFDVSTVGKSPRCTMVLGRYDAVAVGPMRVGNGSWSPATADQTGSKSQYEIKSVSRQKKLIPIAIPKPRPNWTPNREPAIVSTILISLRWDASRLMMAHWLKTKIECASQAHGLGWEAYLSDGWEDLVLLVTQFEPNPLQFVGPVIEMVEELNRSPLVSGTETLFSKIVLTARVEKLRCRFVSGRGVDDLATCKEKIRQCVRDSKIQGIEDTDWIIENVSGAKDIQIWIEDTKPPRTTVEDDYMNQFHQALLKAAEKSFRLETRLSWTDEKKPK